MTLCISFPESITSTVSSPDLTNHRDYLLTHPVSPYRLAVDVTTLGVADEAGRTSCTVSPPRGLHPNTGRGSFTNRLLNYALKAITSSVETGRECLPDKTRWGKQILDPLPSKQTESQYKDFKSNVEVNMEPVVTLSQGLFPIKGE